MTQTKQLSNKTGYKEMSTMQLWSVRRERERDREREVRQRNVVDGINYEFLKLTL